MDGQSWELLMQEPAHGMDSPAEREGMGSAYKYIPGNREEIFQLKNAAAVRMDGDKLLMDREQV